MSDAPERIYLNLGNEQTTYAEAVAAGWEVSWCEGEQDEWDVEYVRADLYEQLQAEVERLREQFTCVWDHNAVTENYPCGCCGYPNGLEDARRIPPQPQEQSE